MAEVESRYAITAEWAKRKAKLLVELAGGKTALQHMHALDAVATGCGFRDWRELGAFIARVEAEGAEAAGVTPQMLADNVQVDEPTLIARMRNQEAAVRKYIKCSPGQIATIVRKWGLSDYTQKHGAPFSAHPTSEPGTADSTPQPSPTVSVTYRKHRTAQGSDAD
jgi:hypothetical protein